MPVTGTLKHFL